MRNFRNVLPGVFLAAALSGCSTSDEYKTEHFSAAPALTMLEALSSDELKGRKVGTEGNARARAMIIERLEEIGVKPVGESFEHPFVYGNFADPATGQNSEPEKQGINIVGYIPGRSDKDISMIVTAHFDHLGEVDGEIYNGADDNASGVVGLLAVAELFAKNPPLHDVVFVGFDAEEDRLGGAFAFVRTPPIDLDGVALNLNFDMLSRGDNGLLWASGTSHWPAIKPIIAQEVSDAPVQIEYGFDEGDGRDDWTMLSDHAAFFRAGIPHLYFGVEDHPDYHRPGDDFEKINQEWFLQAIDSVAAISLALDTSLDQVHAMKGSSTAN